MLRKDIERLTRYVTKLKVNETAESLKKEVKRLSEIALELRKEGSIRENASWDQGFT